jgi:hypothetical protein
MYTIYISMLYIAVRTECLHARNVRIDRISQVAGRSKIAFVDTYVHVVNVRLCVHVSLMTMVYMIV